MLWTRKEKMHTETLSPVVVAESLQHSRMAGLIQVCRPDWSANMACHSARVLITQGIREYREVSHLSDYIVYLGTQLAEHANTLENAQELSMSCELEVRGWAEYWQRFCQMS